MHSVVWRRVSIIGCPYYVKMYSMVVSIILGFDIWGKSS